MTILVIAGGVLIGLVILGSLVDTEGEPVAATSPSASPTPSPSPSPTPSVSPAPDQEFTKVPNVEGLNFQTARRRLRNQGLRVSSSKSLSRGKVGTVLRQEYKAGERVEEGTSVELLIVKPYPRVPQVTGDRLNKARRDLKQKGFPVRVRKQTSSEPKGTVLQQSPNAGSQVRPGRLVTLIVAKPPPEPSGGGGGEGSGRRTDDSLPIASDYDCAGGTGDGPEYVDGPITIVGSDQYGLDSDSDGVGCE